PPRRGPLCPGKTRRGRESGTRRVRADISRRRGAECLSAFAHPIGGVQCRCHPRVRERLREPILFVPRSFPRGPVARGRTARVVLVLRYFVIAHWPSALCPSR